MTALALFSTAVLPIVTLARSQGQKISLTPTVINTKNSQTMELLTAHRNSNPTLTPGAQLAIVDDTALLSEDITTAFADQGAHGTGEISVYTVREGDTLSAISEMFGVSVNTIKWANDITGSTVKPGTELVILPVSGVRHVVKKGDTVAALAKKYHAEVSDILTYNGLSADAALKAGDEVIIPGGELGATTKNPSTPVRSTGTARYAKSADSEAFEPLLVNVSKYPSYPGYYARPVANAIKTQVLHGYNAVDLGAPSGTPILAAADGTVIISRTGGYNGGYGTYVVISHANGTQTLYAHMSKNYMKVGEKVVQGQTIGAMGSTGWSTGSHLHFEIRGAKNPF